MGKTISFVSIKGGVGKTTLALETASSLANNFNKKVLLVDANFSAPNIGKYLDLTNEVTLHDALLGVGLHNAIYESHGIDVVPAAMDYNEKVDIEKLKTILQKTKNRYDFIILDSSPHHSELGPVINASDLIFVVTTPDHVTLSTSAKAAMMAKKEKTPIGGIIINKIRDPKHEHDLEEVEELMGIKVLAKIRDHKKMVEATFHRTPITIHDEDNIISKEIRKLASAICGTPEHETGFFQKLMPWRNLGKEVINRELLKI